MAVNQSARSVRALLTNVGRIALAGACFAVIVSSLTCGKLSGDVARAESAAIGRPPSETLSVPIYESGLKPGWQDWGWGKHDLTQGAARIDFSNFGGWIVRSDAALPANVSGLSFQMFAPSSYGNFLRVRVATEGDDKSFPVIDVGADLLRPLQGGWAEAFIPWSTLNPAGASVDRIVFHAKTKVLANWVRFDKVYLTTTDPKAKPANGAKTPASPASSQNLAVDCRAAGRDISPFIYGVAGTGDPWELGPTARRWGGNPSTRYNWQLSATNVAKDWFFENLQSPDYRDILKDDRKHNAISAVTLPMIGWVAKDTASFGFPVSTLGPQQATDSNRPNAGNGLRKDGSPVHPGPPSQTSVAADPAMIAKWVETIRADEEKLGSRNVRMFILDNEPNLWNSTHRDVHPDPITYDELLDRTTRYGSAVRKADPKALIAGPAEWGWTGYFYSAKDSESSVRLKPDRRAHGDVPLIPWYLGKLREYEKAHGTRILDVLDMHYYPQGNGIYGSASDPATAALRLRSTRSLWDPSYTDESWINDRVRLIPRMKEWVAQNYPGLGISIGEYSFGGEQHMSGALAEAEALGRFGIEGVTYAFYWTFPPKNSPSYWAFRAYRNFDGQGGHFLDRSMTTRMTSDLSLFASRDASGKHLVLIALNLDPKKSARTRIALDGCTPIASVRKFSYTGQAKGISDDGTQKEGSLDETLPPYSISVFDVTLK